SQSARDRACAGCGLEHVVRRERREAASEILGIGLEDQRHEIPVVDIGYRACESLVAIRHGAYVAPEGLGSMRGRDIGLARGERGRERRPSLAGVVKRSLGSRATRDIPHETGIVAKIFISYRREDSQYQA